MTGRCESMLSVCLLWLKGGPIPDATSVSHVRLKGGLCVLTSDRLKGGLCVLTSDSLKGGLVLTSHSHGHCRVLPHEIPNS